MAKQSIQQLLDTSPILQCPQCARRGERVGLIAQGTSLVCTCALCAKVHRFDVSSRGSVNMVPAQKPLLGYTEQFFAARRAVIEHGWYSSLIEQVVQQVALVMDTMPKATPIRIADIGCGEGSYAKAIAQYCTSHGIDAQVFGVDLAKDAIYVATTGGSQGVRWIVADLAALPFADQSIDIIVNVFSPANYSEFKRIQTSYGVVLKVVPEISHMVQVHRAVRQADAERTAEVSSVLHERSAGDLFAQHVSVEQQLRVTQQVEVQPAMQPLLARMTPVLFHREDSTALVSTIHEVTLDAMLLVGKQILE